MRNLLQETLEVLNENDKSMDEVLYVMYNGYDNNGTYKECYCTMEDFMEVAKEINYNDGYGIAEISLNLNLIGKDFWLEREEYDGSEWWGFKTMPQKNEAIYKKPNKEDIF